VERRQVARNHRHPDGEGLDERQSEAFGIAREKCRARSDQMPCKLLIRTIAKFDHVAAEGLVPVENLEDALSLPASLSNNQQPRSVCTEPRNEPRPDFEQQ